MAFVAIATLVVILYSLIVRLTRYQRLHIMKRNLQKSNINEEEFLDLCRSTSEILSSLEFPLIYKISLEFGLFRTYAIPSISALLEQTGRFTQDAPKRYDDTDLLIREIFENPLASERSIKALQRINAIHTQFKGQISNRDMLYVLSVFFLEPIRWINEYGFRTLCTEECDALFRIWFHIGTKMGIHDIPKTLSEYDLWNREYEKRYMVYAPSNETITEATYSLFLSKVPEALHPTIRAVALCLMDTQLRSALKYPDPNPILPRIIYGCLWLRKWIIRHCLLPRPRFLSTRRTPRKANGNTLCPLYHVYGATYKDGYRIEALGSAPSDKLFPRDKCPLYRN